MRMPLHGLAGALGLLLALQGCSNHGGTGSTGGTTADPGSAEVQGELNGQAFGKSASAWLIGAPDDAKRTRVLYVFNREIRCAEIAATAWDEHVTDATQAIEMKLIGTKTGTYPIAANGRPGSGQADANTTLTSHSQTPKEEGASAGVVTLDDLSDGESASGSFDLTFPSGQVTGTFSANYCPNGHEP